MSALSQPKPVPRSTRKPARRVASQRRPRKHPKFAARATETAIVLGVNVVLIGTCLHTLGNMLPQQLTQQAKLQEIKGEVSRTTAHIEQLKQTHQRSLDPEVSRRISEEQGHLIRKNKRNLVWIKPTKRQP
ncbi:hypothetical protein [Acaryochloris sp. IP29b_bin.148]|uniref:slr1601 family putative cell division protein n=1 Tax=Acaryochloris sp. IP29b_bin.148 TaxID=2969218 RepID=UPI00262BE9B3|nr:hypothetical protein [Acaryochloris sp. IP29b_bin.148]